MPACSSAPTSSNLDATSRRRDRVLTLARCPAVDVFGTAGGRVAEGEIHRSRIGEEPEVAAGDPLAEAGQGCKLRRREPFAGASQNVDDVRKRRCGDALGKRLVHVTRAEEPVEAVDVRLVGLL